jgi:integrase
LSPKTVKNLHGILHKALSQAVINGYISSNPATNCVLPRFVKPEILPLNDEQQTDLFNRIRNHRHRDFILFSIYEGMRESEIIGLTWDRVNFDEGYIVIDRQLQLITPDKKADKEPQKRLVGKYGSKGNYIFELPKHDKIRTITSTQSSMDLLASIKVQQEQWAARAGESWVNDKGFVFTNELGEHYRAQTIYTSFKRIIKRMYTDMYPDRVIEDKDTPRLHDLRHTFAVSALQDGVDPKAVSEHMGHYSVAFTLDTYHHFTPHLRKKSAMQRDEKIKRLQAPEQL